MHVSSSIIIAQIDDLTEDCVKISRPRIFYTFREISRQKRYIWVGPGRVESGRAGPVHRFKRFS